MRVADDRGVEGGVAPAARPGGTRPLRAHPGLGEQAGPAGIERIEGIGDHEEATEDRGRRDREVAREAAPSARAHRELAGTGTHGPISAGTRARSCEPSPTSRAL